jgi:RNA polymerase sigma-70 factor (ECF subfamily)
MNSPIPSNRSEFIDPQVEVDVALIQRIAASERRALAEIYENYARSLYAVALRILHDPAEAEDIVHDVFITLWTKAGDFDASRGAPSTWLFALARNRAIDRLRLRTRQTDVLQQSYSNEVAPLAPSASESMSEPLWLREKAATVRSAVESLDPDQRHALELAFFSGMTQREIAAKLGTPLGTVKARIRRGLLRLREKLVRRL